MKKGFTLIELMVSITVFLVVMTISMGSIVSVFESNNKSQTMRTAMGNLNLAVESMAREMRFGKNYHCDVTASPPPLIAPLSCPAGMDSVSFLSSNGQQISYRKSGASIGKSVGGGGYIAVTAPEIVIDDLKFYVLGADNADTLQPRVLIIIKGHAGIGRNQTDFALQTLVSQRQLDL